MTALPEERSQGTQRASGRGFLGLWALGQSVNDEDGTRRTTPLIKACCQQGQRPSYVWCSVADFVGELSVVLLTRGKRFT